MKRHYFYFLLLFTLLAGCSGQRGSVRLNITKSFVTANAGFSGGLYIHGKNASTGEEFSFTLASETSSSVQLKFGTWEIKVLGWENGAEYFEGNVLCGLEKIDFKTDNQSANIQITNPKCKDSAFTNLSFINETNGIVSFKPIPVYTCGALYDITDPTKLKSPTALTPDFCQTYPKAFQKKAKGMKIGLHNKVIGGAIEDGLTTNCIPSTVTSLTESFQTGKLLPTKIPMTISFYKDDTCSTSALEGKYYFPDGLEDTRSREQMGFDAVLSNGNFPMLAVASSISKRGTTPFVNEIPSFNCGQTNPVSCLTLPPRDADFVLSHGWNVVLLPLTTTPISISTPTPISTPNTNTITITNPISSTTITSCPVLQFESSSVSGVQDIKLVNCIDENGQAKLYLNVNYPTAGSSSNQSQYYFSVNGVRYDVVLSDQLWIYRDLQRILGKNESSTPDISNSLLEEGNDGRSIEGIFGELTDFLSPAKVGGLFWDQPCSSTPLSSPITRNVSIQEDGKIANYSLTLTNSPSGTLPTYINSGSLYPILPSSVNRRIIFREFIDLVGYRTKMVLDLACVGLYMSDTARIGKLENQSQEIDSGREFTHKSLMFWNTSANNQTRFEKYEMHIESDISSKAQNRYSSFIRGEKISGTTSSDIQISQIDHHFHFDDNMTPSNTSDDSNHESVGFKEYDISGTKIKQTQHSGLYHKSLAVGDIFNKTMYAEELERIRYGMNKTNDFLITHPDGNYISHYHNSPTPTSEIKAFNGFASWTNSLPVTAPRLISGDLSLVGSKAIVATITDGEAPGLTIYFYDFILNSLSSVTVTVTVTINNEIITNPLINEIKTSVLDSGDFIITISVNGTADTFTHYYATMKMPLSNNVYTPPSITFLPLFDSIPSTIGQLTLTNDSSKFWAASIGESTINYCSVTPTASTPLTCHEVSNAFQTSDFGKHLSMTCLKNSLDQVSLTLFENRPLEQTSGITATTFLINNDGIISTKTVEPNVSGSSFWMNNLMLDMNDMNKPPAYFDISIPYVRPIIPGFEMNYMSLNPLFMEQNVFTNKATFEGL